MCDRRKCAREVKQNCQWQKLEHPWYSSSIYGVFGPHPSVPIKSPKGVTPRMQIQVDRILDKLLSRDKTTLQDRAACHDSRQDTFVENPCHALPILILQCEQFQTLCKSVCFPDCASSEFNAPLGAKTNRPSWVLEGRAYQQVRYQ